MSATLKLFQLNIEGSRHLNRVIPFLKQHQPDVVCVQELKEVDVAFFEKELGMKCAFTPMSIDHGARAGLGILTALPVVATRSIQYGGQKGEALMPYVHGDRLAGYNSSRFLLAIADIEHEGNIFRIATTHFPVTDHGEASDYQREDMKNLLALLKDEKEFVITGDFNAPRGGEIFAMLAANYKDNIPPEVTTSIDGSLHRAGQLPHMVDGIFSTPAYAVSNVVGHTGLSDHWGFSAEVSKTRK